MEAVCGGVPPNQGQVYTRVQIVGLKEEDVHTIKTFQKIAPIVHHL